MESASRVWAPRLTECGHLFCTPCLAEAQQGGGGQEVCPECSAPGGLATAMLLHTPLLSLIHI